MDEASNTAASNSGEKQKFFAGSVTFCGAARISNARRFYRNHSKAAAIKFGVS